MSPFPAFSPYASAGDPEMALVRGDGLFSPIAIFSKMCLDRGLPRLDLLYSLGFLVNALKGQLCTDGIESKRKAV